MAGRHIITRGCRHRCCSCGLSCLVTINGTQAHSIRLPSYMIAFETIFGLPNERLSIRHDAGSGADPYVAGTLLATRKVIEVSGLVRGLDQLLYMCLLIACLTHFMRMGPSLSISGRRMQARFPGVRGKRRGLRCSAAFAYLKPALRHCELRSLS
jgi:hypothetical protein